MHYLLFTNLGLFSGSISCLFASLLWLDFILKLFRIITFVLPTSIKIIIDFWFYFLVCYIFWLTSSIHAEYPWLTEGCKHNSWIPKLHGSVAHKICHSRFETLHALDNIFSPDSFPPLIQSFTVGINSIHQHSSFLTFNLTSVSLQQHGIYSTIYFSWVEDFLPVGHIQAKHTHELGELTHQTGNTLHTEANVVNTSHTGCERSFGSRKERWWPQWLVVCDYCSVVTFILKGEGLAPGLPGGCTTVCCFQSHILKLTYHTFKLE